MRIGEHRRIVVGGAEQRSSRPCPAATSTLADPGVATGTSGTRTVSCTGPSNRSSSSTAFAPMVGSSRQRASSSRWRSKRERPVADQVDGRLVTGDVQQHHERQQLGRGHPVPGLLCRDQRRQQVVAGMPAAVLDHRRARSGPSAPAASSAASRSASSAVGSSAAVRICDHSPQLLGPFGRHVEQLGDHLERHREGQLVDGSISPRSAARSSTSSTIAWIRGRNRSIAVGVKARLTSRRNRVWSGGSRLRIVFATVPSRRRWRRRCRRSSWPGSVGSVAFSSMSREVVAPQGRDHVVVPRQHDRPDGADVDRAVPPQLVVEGVGIGAEGRVERGLRGASSQHRVPFVRPDRVFAPGHPLRSRRALLERVHDHLGDAGRRHDRKAELGDAIAPIGSEDRGVDEARVERTDADAVDSSRRCQRSHESDDGMLRDAVDRVHRHADQAGERRSDENVAATAVRTCSGSGHGRRTRPRRG